MIVILGGAHIVRENKIKLESWSKTADLKVCVCDSLPEKIGISSIPSEWKYIQVIDRQWATVNMSELARKITGILYLSGPYKVELKDDQCDPDIFEKKISNQVSQLFNFITQHLSKLGEGASIVFVSSTLSGKVAPADAPAEYHIAKAGLDALARYLAVTLAPKVRVNTLNPGLITRSDQSSLINESRLKKAVADAVPLRRPATWEELIDVAEFLLSDKSRYLTGHHLICDGGQSILETFSVAKSNKR